MDTEQTGQPSLWRLAFFYARRKVRFGRNSENDMFLIPGETELLSLVQLFTVMVLTAHALLTWFSRPGYC